MKYLYPIQVIISILLMLAVLLQSRESGLSGIFGGGGTIYRTKRGVEKILFNATIVLAALFLILSLVNVLVTNS